MPRVFRDTDDAATEPPAVVSFPPPAAPPKPAVPLPPAGPATSVIDKKLSTPAAPAGPAASTTTPLTPASAPAAPAAPVANPFFMPTTGTGTLAPKPAAPVAPAAPPPTVAGVATRGPADISIGGGKVGGTSIAAANDAANLRTYMDEVAAGRTDTKLAPPSVTATTPAKIDTALTDQGGKIALMERAAPELQAGADENRVDFQAVDPSIEGPSDFLSFDRFAGLNDDLMRQIADRNSSQSELARQAALGFLNEAEKESNAGTPVEKTASYAKYLDAMKKANEASGGFGALKGADTRRYAGDITGNPYEDALRGVYSGAQTARENRLQTNATNRAGLSARNRDRLNTNLATMAAERAAAEKAAQERALEKEAAPDERRAAAQEAADRAEAINRRKGATDQGRTAGDAFTDEYTARNRQGGAAGRNF